MKQTEGREAYATEGDNISEVREKNNNQQKIRTVQSEQRIIYQEQFKKFSQTDAVQ